MQPRRQHSRINLAELKAQIARKLGPERSKQYFYCLNRLLSSKLSKVEFEKLCIQVVGRENITLHNQFIRSILKNACSAKLPPPIPDNEGVKTPADVGEKETSHDNHFQNGCRASVAHSSSSPGLPGDRHKALGLNGKNRFASQQLMTTRSGDVILENGALTPTDTQIPVKHHSLLSRFSEKEDQGSVQNSNKFSVPKRSPDGPFSVHSKDQRESSAGRDWRKMHARRSLQAPFGVPFCPVRIGGLQRALSVPSSSKCISASGVGGLLDSVMLRERIEHISVTQGLEGVSTDCANILNNGLDAYLKRIIESCIGLVGARSGREPLTNSINKQQTLMRLINGVKIDHRFQMPVSGRPSDVMHKHRQACPISLQDFRSAMELNQQQLGDYWPLLLEKICIRSFDE